MDVSWSASRRADGSALTSTPRPSTACEARRACCVFKALSDPTRREIIKLLRSGPQTAGDIAARFPVAWPMISRHLAMLRDAGIVSAERDGSSVRYELNATVLQELVGVIYDWTRKGGRNA